MHAGGEAPRSSSLPAPTPPPPSPPRRSHRRFRHCPRLCQLSTLTLYLTSLSSYYQHPQMPEVHLGGHSRETFHVARMPGKHWLERRTVKSRESRFRVRLSRWCFAGCWGSGGRGGSCWRRTLFLRRQRVDIVTIPTVFDGLWLRLTGVSVLGQVSRDLPSYMYTSRSSYNDR